MALILSFLLQFFGISCETTGVAVRLLPWTEEVPTQTREGASVISMRGQGQRTTCYQTIET